MQEQNAPPIDDRLRVRKLLRVALVVVALLAVYHLSTTALAERWNSKAPRNPETGILIGAEPQDLGSKDAEVAVLLVHGILGGGSNFGELSDRLVETGVYVRIMRLPGHGTSPRDLAKTSPDELLQGVLGEARALRRRYKKVILVGHSMGGTLSTLVAAAPDTNLDGLVLAAPYFGVTHRWFYGLRPEQWTKLTSPVVRWTYKGKPFFGLNRREAIPDILSYRWTPSKGFLAMIELGERANKAETLDSVTCPVLMLHGQDDRAAAIGKARRAFEGMASETKTFATLKNSDHHLFWDYDRARVIEDVVRFVKKVAAD